jgi:hypothetical protein
MTHDWEIAVVGTCPVCGQGRQWIVSDTATNRLYVSCEECEAQWDSPHNLKDTDAIRGEGYGRHVKVRVEDIRKHPWFAFVTNKEVLGR